MVFFPSIEEANPADLLGVVVLGGYPKDGRHRALSPVMSGCQGQGGMGFIEGEAGTPKKACLLAGENGSALRVGDSARIGEAFRWSPQTAQIGLKSLSQGLTRSGMRTIEQLLEVLLTVWQKRSEIAHSRLRRRSGCRMMIFR
jgi:hypothetical protein